jgi:chloramphenicol O-acetyltransferase type A
MKHEINPQESNRAEAFNMWMSSPVPMVTLVKTFDVSRLVKVSKKSGINLCDVPFADNIEQFNANYLELTSKAASSCQSTALEDYMIIGTSALPQTELDCIVNQYSGRWNNPFLAWGRYRKWLFKTTLPISLQFHHAQMDGAHACHFLNNLQDEINKMR